MKKKRLIWTILMLLVMVLSLVTMFLPWSRSLGGGEAALPGTILRRVLAVLTVLVFLGSVFLFFTRRTAWGILYALVQGINLGVVRAVTNAANTEAGARLYGMTNWYAVCVFLTAAVALVWILGLIMGAWKRPAVKHKADLAADDHPTEKRLAAKKAARSRKSEGRENKNSRWADRETTGDEEYDEALAIAEEAERMRAKAEAARKAAEAAHEAGPEGGSHYNAGTGLKDRGTSAPSGDADADGKLPWSAADPTRSFLGDRAVLDQAPAAPEAEGAKNAVYAASARKDIYVTSAKETSDADGETEGRRMAEDQAAEKRAEGRRSADKAGAGPMDEEAEEDDYLDVAFMPLGPGQAAASAVSGVGTEEASDLSEDDLTDEEDEEQDNKKKPAEGNEDFMDALGGFLGNLFAATKKGAGKAASGIRAKAQEARARRKTEDELAAEEELAEEDDLAEEDEPAAEAEMTRAGGLASDGQTPEAGTDDEPGLFSPEAVSRNIMPDADSRKTKSMGRSAMEVDDMARDEGGFHIFGREKRDEVEEEPKFLRDRRKKNRSKQDKSDRKPGFVPSVGLIVKVGLGLAAVILAVVAAFLLVRRFKLESIDMEDYVVISSSGYEGYGVAEIKVDSEGLEKAVAEALVRKGQIKAGSEGAVEAFRAFESYNIIMEQTGFTMDKRDHLSNGDVVTVTFSCDNTVLKEFGLKAGPERLTHTVSGLSEVKEYSPFDSDLTVEFTGTEPYGQIVLTWTGSYPLHFTKSQSEGLSNGDVVVVTALPNDGYDDEMLAVEYGIILKETTKEFPVTGLSNYIRDVSGLTDAALIGLDEEARAIIQDKAAGAYGKNETMAACERVGSLILTGTEETEARNYLYMVYKLTYQRAETSFDYYYYVRFRNVILHTDGSYEKDETSEVPTGRHGLFGLLDNDDALRIDWLHAVVGFETIEDIYTKKIADKVGVFTVSTDLAITGIPADSLTPAGGTSGTAVEPTVSPEAAAPGEDVPL